MTKSGQLSRRVGVNKLKSMYKVFLSPLQLIGSGFSGDRFIINPEQLKFYNNIV